ncbi:uncharacterized protein LOC130998361 [Salvia miltiorrhiza]|uniref:uncharacterized protein LOC130998361 n=1 Tax=Salvia miltiorrhiza TaxID=226208 RepID=UPI0025AC840E|nr:uncharacterized protein LOC130998361 [Salvia miltiorrhiza]
MNGDKRKPPEKECYIPTQDISCVLCQEKTEDSNHLFFSCQKATEVWYDLLSWIGKSAALHSSASNHLMGFSNIGHKKDILFLTGLWICTVWCIWKKRNDIRFKQGKWSRDGVTAEIKSHVWSWLQVFSKYGSSADFSFRDWFNVVPLAN